MHLYSSANNDILINMMSVGRTTTVDLIQPFTDESDVNAFRELLAGAGIEFTVSERIIFTTPCDGIADTPAVEAVRRGNNLMREYLDRLTESAETLLLKKRTAFPVFCNYSVVVAFFA